MTLSRRTFSAAVGSLAIPLPLVASAQDAFPSKPIRIICPFAPGGGSDFIARVASNLLSKGLGQSAIVDNRPGAGGTLGTEVALHAPADGYTLLLIAGSYTVNPSLYKLKFDPIADMTPVIQLSKGAYVVCINPNKVKATNLQELLAYGRQNPGKLTFASAGNGSHLHIVTEYMFGMAQVKATHVPYKGTGPAVTDLVAGNVDMLVAGTEALMPHVKSGRLRALAVTTAQRLPAYPDIPSVAESGLRDYDVVAWHGLIAPKGVPPATIAKINGALNTGLKAPELVAQLDPTGVSPAGGTPEQFGNLIKVEIPRYAKVAKDNNIKAD
ncbi:tripartite tricarboxylate transporter substrate binding protein [Variovorax sp. Sphag1AA]|uniref:Bug family tripartite tricarboxylate transporter substrate binding protein n=1 Tax=Variovorax sp. Sphag1AA TaxID=2587027 RepID=UPI00160FECE1|nr:tripartite tricarboxylate transporter substrate binding protein [Variovorax sp. Sphag1AA]MBB3178582.1 tripartite-type tricarboxylate transporter receptor subunit TctC [Variovorax sp. Sphag1AA]